MKEYSISKDKIRFLRYDVDVARMFCHIYEHPQTQMHKLGINILIAVPESMAGCWMVLTDYQGELPEYIKERELKPHNRYWYDWDIDIKE